MEVQNTVLIRRPVSDVFSFVTDWRNAPQWVAGLLETEITSADPTGVGTKFRDVGKFLGRRIETTWEVAEYTVDEVFTVRTLKSPVPARLTHLFEVRGEAPGSR